MIEVHNLRIDYDDFCAVRDLNLVIPDGEVFGLIGPNGAGKTTTLRTMTGLMEPTFGDIIIDGIDLSLQREKAIAFIGFMPDFAPIYEDLTVYEFLDLFAASYNIPKQRREETIDLFLELVELTDKRDQFTAGLSRGMKQRLILAKTLLPEPKIILLDEPASGLDPHGRVLLKNILGHLASEGKTVLISSHILVELSEFCTSVGIMEKGRMVLAGRIDEIAERVLGKAEIELEVLEDSPACLQVLAGNHRVGTTRQQGTQYFFPFDGGPEEACELLTVLITTGVRVTSFRRKKEDLEEVFLKVGAKEVS